MVFKKIIAKIMAEYPIYSQEEVEDKIIPLVMT